MTLDQLFSTLFSLPLFFFVKTFLIVALLFHAVFSFVLIRQARRMIQIVEAHINPFIYLLVILHFVASLLVLFVVVTFG